MEIPVLVENNVKEKESDKMKNKSKNFILISDNNEYNILFENNSKVVYISCECNNKKSEQKLKYKNQFSLYEIQKVKWFLAYDTLDECLTEIFQILNEKKGIIKEENDNQLNLIIPLNSKKFSEILFPLYKKEISDKEKIDELYEIINSLNEKNNEQRKQIINLKEKLYDINDQEIRIYGGKNEKLNGISIDLSLFGKEDIKKFLKIIFLKKKKEKNIYM